MKSAAKGCLAVVWLLVLLPPGIFGSPEQPGPNMGPWVQVVRFVVPRYVGAGVNVSLECDYVVQQHAALYSLKWYKGNSQFYQYIPSKTEPHAAFSVPGLHRHQLDWSLQASGREGRVVRLTGLSAGASDVYRCELVAEGPPFHTTQRSANMTVVVLPRGPPTITGSRGHYQPNQRLELNCTAPPASPAPVLTWTLNGRLAPADSVRTAEQVVTPADQMTSPFVHVTSTSSLLVRATTQLSLRVTHHHFRSGSLTIVCEAQLGSFYTRSHQVTIPGPDTKWYSSLNLYHASAAARSPVSVSVGVTILAPLVALRHLLP